MIVTASFRDQAGAPCTGGRSAVVISAIAVLLTACALDVLAAHTPAHVLGVAVLAAVLGLARVLSHGRGLGGFAVVNLAVLAAPAAHALTALTRAGSSRLSQPGTLDEVSAVGVGVALTVLVVVVAGSEPILGVLARAQHRTVRTLVGGGPAPAPDEPGVPHPPRGGRAVARTAPHRRCRPRRGPPHPDSPHPDSPHPDHPLPAGPLPSRGLPA